MSTCYEDNTNCGCAIELPSYELANDVKPATGIMDDDLRVVQKLEDLIAQHGVARVLKKLDPAIYVDLWDYFEAESLKRSDDYRRKVF